MCRLWTKDTTAVTWQPLPSIRAPMNNVFKAMSNHWQQAVPDASELRIRLHIHKGLQAERELARGMQLEKDVQRTRQISPYMPRVLRVPHTRMLDTLS